MSKFRHWWARDKCGRVGLACGVLAGLLSWSPCSIDAQVRKFPLDSSDAAPTLERSTHAGSFMPVSGRTSAWLGYEHRGLEAWIYPLQLIDDLRLSFSLEGYPLDIAATDIATSIAVRPEATVITHAHAAFTVRQILFAPLDKPALVMLLDITTTLPLTVSGSFRPRLRPMWPAGLMTPYVDWDSRQEAYILTEESRRFVGIVGVPGGRDRSVMPYQEEPRNQPLRFDIDTRKRASAELIPIILAGSVEGRDAAVATYRAIAADVPGEYARVVAYWKTFAQRTLTVETPDARMNTALAWAKVGTAKGLATNPMLGTGFVAGFRTAGESERPGFAWFFGRDALWSSLAVTSYGDTDSVKSALDFLKKYQRQDGKIPHEISQSATLVPWFDQYPYAWASADATPLYVIAHADLWRFAGDRAYLDASLPSILSAYRFTRGTDTDSNGLVENTAFGHGWVEGGALYPPHEEIYQQGVWIEAQRALADVAAAVGDTALAREAREGAARTLAATEEHYWLEDRGLYAFATRLPTDTPTTAEPGPERERRQQRLNELARATLLDEDTVLPAVPLWWGQLSDERAQREIDRIGSGRLATDWGTRLLADDSRLYDPLSYHYGSVWPLFTGWASMAAYRYGRPHVGFQAITATANLTWPGALGYITELLSGDFNVPFGRSSHHQIWSEAMLITPMVRGLLGFDVRDAGRELRLAPQLPPHWDKVRLGQALVDGRRWSVELTRSPGRLRMTIAPEPLANPSPDTSARRDAAAAARAVRVSIAPAFPLDARIRRVVIGNRPLPFRIDALGDIQRPEVTADLPPEGLMLDLEVDEGTDVWVDVPAPAVGAGNVNLKILRARADRSRLQLSLEGRGGREYKLHVRTPATLVPAGEGVSIQKDRSDVWTVTVRFAGDPATWVRRDIEVVLRR